MLRNKCSQAFNMLLLQLVSLFFIQSDPTLERHFKGHRDNVTSVDFSCNMKQIGNFYLILLFVCNQIICCTCLLLSLYVIVCNGMFSTR